MTIEKKQQVNKDEPKHLDTYQQVEQFFLKNRNIIFIVVGIIIVGIGGYFGYKKLYMEPREEDTQNKIAYAQTNFSKDSINAALNGDGINAGFLSIIENYGNTPTGNISKYYAAICYINLLKETKDSSNMDKAIDMLEKYDPKTDEVAGKTYELLGSLYADKKNYTKAIDYYKKAGDASKNNLQSPMYYKYAGDLMAMQNDYKGALEMYKKIKKEYPLSTEGQNIDLDISYAETKIGE